MSESFKSVVVTGASSQTGRITVRNLLRLDNVKVRATVRSNSSEKKLRNYLKEQGVEKGLDIKHLDVTTSKDEEFDEAFKDMDTLVIITSAVPKFDYGVASIYLPMKLFPFLGRKQLFYYPPGGHLREVDYRGGMRQIDASVRNKIKHIIMVSAMGGANPNNFFNKNMDNLILWKNKTELYLMNACKQAGGGQISYTIIHPGGLSNSSIFAKHVPGKRRLIVSTVPDDHMLMLIPREDLANLISDAVVYPEACRNSSFNLVSKTGGDVYNGGKEDFEKLMKHVADCPEFTYPSLSVITSLE